MRTASTNLKKKANLRNAVILLVLFAFNAVLLGRVDQPLEDLANGEPKLDLRFGYDRSTVEMLFSAYGEQGRIIYGWNLLVDTPFPILGAGAVILFVLLAFRSDAWQKLLILPPVVFMATDLIENILLFTMVQAYPTQSTTLIDISSAITQIKRTAYYISAMELIISVLLVIYGSLRRKPAPARLG